MPLIDPLRDWAQSLATSGDCGPPDVMASGCAGGAATAPSGAPAGNPRGPLTAVRPRVKITARWGIDPYRRFRRFLWGSVVGFEARHLQAYRWVLQNRK